MKNAIFLLVVFFGFFTKIQAQSDSQTTITKPFKEKGFLKKVKGDLFASGYVFRSLKGGYFPNYSITIGASIETTLTHNHLGYDLVSNSITTLNGVFIDETRDVYFFASKLLSANEWYFSGGYERFFEGKIMNKILFIEFGAVFGEKVLPGVNAGVCFSFNL